MIEAVLIELDALVAGGGPRPGAPEALAALGRMERRAGGAMAVGVLDGGLNASAVRERLEGAGLGGALAGPGAITTAEAAGAAIPDRRLFLAALERLGAGSALGRSAVVLEGPHHAGACRALGLAVLARGEDFGAWPDVPLLVALRTDRASRKNLAIALGARLGPDFEDVSVKAVEPTRIVAGARTWVKVSAKRVPPDVHVRVAVEVVVRLDAERRVLAVEAEPPAPELLAEAASNVAGLLARGEVAVSGRPGPGTTHVLETDGRGRRLLKRSRFA